MKRNTTARLQSADSQTKRFGIEMLTPTMIILIIILKSCLTDMDSCVLPIITT